MLKAGRLCVCALPKQISVFHYDCWNTLAQHWKQMMNQIGDTKSESLTPFTTSFGGVDIVRRRTTQYILQHGCLCVYVYVCRIILYIVCASRTPTHSNCAGSDFVGLIAKLLCFRQSSSINTVRCCACSLYWWRYSPLVLFFFSLFVWFGDVGNIIG